MKFLIDQQLPPALASWLIEKGHKADHVYPLGLGEADDRDIWRLALNEGAVIVTKDIDFVERGKRGRGGLQVLWLRIGNTTTAELLSWLAQRWPAIEVDLIQQDPVVEVR